MRRTMLVRAVAMVSVVATAGVSGSSLTVLRSGGASGWVGSKPTHMYIGKSLVGELSEGSGRLWSPVGDRCYSNGMVVMGKGRNWIYVNYMDGHHAGYSRRLNAGRWAIYRTRTRVEGTAVRRSATRWDVLQNVRLFGHTVGPDGEAATAALLLLCH
jgi:hypothetical protein